MPEFRAGPDSARYLLAGSGHKVARPFNLRWLLPAMFGADIKLWRAVWWLSWPVAAAGLVWWGLAANLAWQQAAAMPVLVLALAGVWGPHVVRPVGVDLPAMTLSILAVAAITQGGPWTVLAVVLIVLAGATKESAPVWAALWAWHPLLLVGLVAPAIIAVFNRPALDEVTATPILRHVHDHPVRSAWEHHRHKLRDPRMVTQWGGCLAALYAAPVQVWAVLAAAYAQLVVATDTYRLIHTAAGPALAFYAVQAVPVPWLGLLCAASAVWWLNPEFQ
jgi:hypothetical protein